MSRILDALQSVLAPKLEGFEQTIAGLANTVERNSNQLLELTKIIQDVRETVAGMAADNDHRKEASRDLEADLREANRRLREVERESHETRIRLEEARKQIHVIFRGGPPDDPPKALTP